MGDKEDFHFGDLLKFATESEPEEEEKTEFQKKKEIIKKHPIVKEFTEMMEELEEEKEVEITHPVVKEAMKTIDKLEEEREIIIEEVEETLDSYQQSIQDLIDKIEKIEIRWDLDLLQKLITVKNVLNFTQSTWSLGVCNEILGEGSLRGGKKEVGSGLIRTIKKICKLR